MGQKIVNEIFVNFFKNKILRLNLFLKKIKICKNRKCFPSSKIEDFENYFFEQFFGEVPTIDYYNYENLYISNDDKLKINYEDIGIFYLRFFNIFFKNLKKAFKDKQKKNIFQKNKFLVMNKIKKIRFDIYLEFLKDKEKENKKKIKSIFDKINKSRIEIKNEEKFFCYKREEKNFSKSQKKSVLLNSIKESDILYNLKCSFPIEENYFKILEQKKIFEKFKNLIYFQNALKMYYNDRAKNLNDFLNFENEEKKDFQNNSLLLNQFYNLNSEKKELNLNLFENEKNILDNKISFYNSEIKWNKDHDEKDLNQTEKEESNLHQEITFENDSKLTIVKKADELNTTTSKFSKKLTNEKNLQNSYLNEPQILIDEKKEKPNVYFNEFSKSEVKTNKIKQSQKLTQKKILLPSDIYCFVCNDPEYSDQNNIVFCALCNISVHQICYGIKKIPEGDWICDLCLQFREKGKFVDCFLCTCRGGVLKESEEKYFTSQDNLGKNAFMEKIDEQRKENEEWDNSILDKMYLDFKTEFLNENNSVVNNKFFAVSDYSHFSLEESLRACNNINKEKREKEAKKLIYNTYKEDFHFSKKEIEKNTPKLKNWWVHLSCLYFTQLGKTKVKQKIFFKKNNTKLTKDWVYFKKKKTINKSKKNVEEKKEKIKNNKKKFCMICHQICGGIIECIEKKCKNAFHVECARRVGFNMDLKEREIYCYKHTPFSPIQDLKYEDQRIKEDIRRFPKMIKNFLKLNEVKFDVFSRDELQENNFVKIEKDFGFEELIYFLNREDILFYKSLKQELIKEKDWKFVVKLEKLRENDFFNSENTNLKKDQKEQTNKDNLNSYLIKTMVIPQNKIFKNKIPKSSPVWANLSKKQEITKTSVIGRYLALEKKLIYLKKNQKKLIKRKKEEINIPIKKGFNEEKYCICEKNWKGEFLVYCDECNNPFHPECIGYHHVHKIILEEMYVTCFDCKNKFKIEYSLSDSFYDYEKKCVFYNRDILVKKYALVRNWNSFDFNEKSVKKICDNGNGNRRKLKALDKIEKKVKKLARSSSFGLNDIYDEKRGKCIFFDK